MDQSLEARRTRKNDQQKERRAGNPKQQRQERREKYEANQVLADSYLTECVDCGNDDIRVLEFDHVLSDPIRTRSGKRKSRGGLAGGGRRVMIREIEMCEVRCANCHKIRHREERDCAVA